MSKFKAGDVVVATRDIDEGRLIRMGKQYTVARIGAIGPVIVGHYENGGIPLSGLKDEYFQLAYQPPVVESRERNGAKDDGGKLDVSLLFDDMPHALYEVVKVLQWAVKDKKPVPYVRGSWQTVPDLQRRYRAAQMRHELNAAISRIDDPGAHPVDAETGLNELAHIATSALFRLEMAVRSIKKGGQV